MSTSTVRVRSGAPGTARRSGPGRHTSLLMIWRPSAPTTSRIEDTTRWLAVRRGAFQVHDEVQGRGDQEVGGLHRQPLGALHRVGGELGERALAAEECRVPMLPSLPMDIALVIGMTSGPRTSPTMTRSGCMRSDCHTRSDSEIAPTAFQVGFAGLQRDHVRVLRRPRRGRARSTSSMVIRRSHAGIAEARPAAGSSCRSPCRR